MKIFLFLSLYIIFLKEAISNNLSCSTLVTTNIQELEYCANKNNAFSQYNLAVIYRDGIGVKSDFGKAFHWFKKSADLGFSNAKLFLRHKRYSTRSRKSQLLVRKSQKKRFFATAINS